MTQPDVYLLGRGKSEELRLKRQIADLAPLSDAQLVEVGIKAGEQVVDLGCGPGGVLHLLGKRVGPTGPCPWHRPQLALRRTRARFRGSDLGPDPSRGAGRRRLRHGLPRASFDGAHMRLVLVNVPKPELIVREMVSLVRPGGWVASFEADVEAMVLDPPSAEYIRLRRAYNENARSRGLIFSLADARIACSGRRVSSRSR